MRVNIYPRLYHEELLFKNNRLRYGDVLAESLNGHSVYDQHLFITEPRTKKQRPTLFYSASKE